jgi:hypothetical protein
MAHKRPRLSASATALSAPELTFARATDMDLLQHRSFQKPLPKDVRLQAVPGSSPGRVSFVRASGTAASGTTSHRERDDLLARLNFSAADERRKALLERLRAIDQARSDLAAKAAAAAAAAATAPAVDAAKEVGTQKDLGPAALSAVDMALPTSPTDTCPPVDGGQRATHDPSPSSPTSVCVSASVSTTMPKHSPENDIASTVPSAPPSPAAHATASPLTASTHCPSSAVSTQDTAPDCDPDACSLPDAHLFQGRCSTAPSSAPSTESSAACLGKRTSRSRIRSVMISAMPGETALTSFSGISKCKALAFARKLIHAIIRKPTARPFSAPVQDLWPPSAIPRYFDVIALPMDLGTIKRRLDGTHYLTRVPIGTPLALGLMSDVSPSVTSNLSPAAVTAAAAGFVFDLAAFCEDVRLCFRNCMVYCPEQDVLFRCAKALMEEFDEEVLDAPRPAPIFPEGTVKKLLKDKNCAREKVKVNVSTPRTRKRPCNARSVPKARLSSHQVPGGKHSKSRGQGKVDAKSCRTPPSGTSTRKRSAAKSQATVLKVDNDAVALEERLEYLLRCRSSIAGGKHDVSGEDLQMSFEEKSRLSARLSAVPVDKICELVAILSSAAKREKNVIGTEEIEIDMDKLDLRTLRKVEELVDSCVDPKIGGRPKSGKIRKAIDLTEFDGIVEIDGEIAALTAQLQQVKAAAGTTRAGGLWDDSSSSESDGLSGASSSGDSESSDESEAD